MIKHANEQAEIKFFHGWAYQANSWQGWQQFLGDVDRLEFYDRGYFGGPNAVAPFLQGSHRKIVIAHSLGLHFVPMEILKNAHLIVMIGAFKHFHECSGDQSSSLATTRAMRNRLQRNAERVLRDFYSHSGDLEAQSSKRLSGEKGEGAHLQGLNPNNDLLNGDTVNIDLLMQDLHLLDRSSYDLENHPVEASTVLLHGEKDVIAHADHARSLASVLPHTVMSVHPTANHALPFRESEWCFLQLARICPEVFARESSRVVTHVS